MDNNIPQLPPWKLSNKVISPRATVDGVKVQILTTTERDAIVTPPLGLIIYNSTTKELNQFNGTIWIAVGSGGGGGGTWGSITGTLSAQTDLWNYMAGLIYNLDGGYSDSTYGGIAAIDGGASV